MKIVLDTNVLLSAVLPTSRYHWILDQVNQGELTMCVSTDILSEYAELLERFYNPIVADATLTALLYSPNVEQYSPSYFWRFIEADHDDDKFADCAIASGADAIVTFDRHFNILKTISFPKVRVINPDDFRQLLAR